MKRRLIEGLAGLSVGGLLLWWVLRGFTWEGLSGLWGKWPWLGLAAFSMTLAHVLRAWRWQLMLRGSGAAVDFPPTFWALMVGYLFNTALPRIGEVIRCTFLWRWRSIPVVLSLGSVLAERLIDLAILGLLALSVGAVEGLDWVNQLGLRRYLPFLLGALPVGALLLWAGIVWLRRHPKKGLLYQLREGFLGILRARPYFLTATLSLLIWVGYWGAVYGVMEAATKETSQPLPWSAWVLLVGSGVAMALPIPGGIGTFHAIGLILLLGLGWPKQEALLTVLAAHALQTLLVVGLGFFGLLYGVISRARQTPGIPGLSRSG